MVENKSHYPAQPSVGALELRFVEQTILLLPTFTQNNRL